MLDLLRCSIAIALLYRRYDPLNIHLASKGLESSFVKFSGVECP